jgi:hypothetical protein
MGLRRSTTKLSARCMRKRENLSAMIESISSICLIFMLIRHCAAPHTKVRGLRSWQGGRGWAALGSGERVGGWVGGGGAPS